MELTDKRDLDAAEHAIEEFIDRMMAHAADADACKDFVAGQAIRAACRRLRDLSLQAAGEGLHNVRVAVEECRRGRDADGS